jgi:hypothetical protein
VRDAKDADFAKVRSKNWLVSKEQAQKVHDLEPTKGEDRFYRFAYKRYAMFFRNENRITAIDPSKAGKEPTLVQNLEKTRDRLDGVKIHNDSYEKIIKAYDGKDTFFYLDPPYPRIAQEVGEDKFDEAAFIKTLVGIKGKFLLHYDHRDKSKFINKGWLVKVISVNKTGGGTAATVKGKLLEVTNYTPTKKAESYVPPKSVQTEAAKGLELRRTGERGGLDVSEAAEEGVGSGVQRATNLKNGDNISLSTIKRMRNFFSRHQDNYRPNKKMPDGGPTAGTIAWLLWGGDPGKEWADTILQTQEKSASDVSWTMPIIKKDDDERIVTGIVLEPDEVDAQGDTVSKEAIKEAAYSFLAKFNKDTKLGFMHKAFGNLGISLVESWVAREDCKYGGNAVKSGSWLMSVKVDKNDTLWKKIKEGEISGFSIGGVARVS